MRLNAKNIVLKGCKKEINCLLQTNAVKKKTKTVSVSVFEKKKTML